MLKTFFSSFLFGLALSFLALLSGTPSFAAEEIRCEGEYPAHLQGFASDGEHIFWSFTSVLVQTDLTGKILRKMDVPSHHGDCCVADGKLYVSTHLRWPRADAESWIYVYECSDLAFVTRFRIEKYDLRGVDGISFHDGFFYVGIGKDPKDTTPFNLLLKLTPKFEIVETYEVPGETTYGFQSSCWADGSFWFGTYGRNGTRTLQCGPDLKVIANQPINVSVGVFGLPQSANGEVRLMAAQHHKNEETGKCWASARPVVLKDGKLEWEK